MVCRVLLCLVLLSAGQSFGSSAEPFDAAAALARFRDAFERGELPRALVLGEGLLRHARRTAGEGSIEVAAYWHNLASVRERMGDADGAIEGFEQAVAIIEQVDMGSSRALLSSLQRLGVLCEQQGYLLQAQRHFLRAQQVLQREEGVYALAQAGLVGRLAGLALRMQDLRQAERMQRLYLSLYLRHYGDQDPRTVPARVRVADWYRLIGDYEQALDRYEAAAELLESAGVGGRALYLPLAGIARTRHLQGGCCAAKLMRRAVNALAADATVGAVEHAEALLELADLYQVSGKDRAAARLYRCAWAMLDGPDAAGASGEMHVSSGEAHSADEPRPDESRRSSEPQALGLQRAADVVMAYRRAAMAPGVVQRVSADSFGFTGAAGTTVAAGAPRVASAEATAPGELVGGPLPMCLTKVAHMAGGAERLEDLVIDLAYSVDERGRVRDVHIVESNAPNRLTRFVTSLLHRYRYRPAFEDGRPVATDDVRLRQTFDARLDVAGDEAAPFGSNRLAVFHGCHMLAWQNL